MLMSTFSGRELRLILTCLIFNDILHLIDGKPDGAPEKACGDLSTRHKIPPSKTSNPYHVSLSSDYVKPGEKLIITLRGSNAFKGFLIQVRLGNKPIGKMGKFPEGTKLSCGATAVTHANPTDKKSVTVEWIPPKDAIKGNYEVHYTVAQTYGMSWVDATEKFSVLKSAAPAFPPSVSRHYPIVLLTLAVVQVHSTGRVLM